ncbi:DUF378 domain-containing protein [Bacillaceae bacterium W0354]
MGALRKIALALVIIGAINWGLIGFFDFDLVATLFGGQDAALSRVIYSLVGISGLICISLLFVSDREEYVRNVNYATEFSEETDPTDFRE